MKYLISLFKSELTQRAKNLFPSAKVEIIENIRDYSKKNKYTLKDYSQREKNLFIINENYDFFATRYPEFLYVDRVVVDQNFAGVIVGCAAARAEPGTWITADMQAAYLALHQAGYAHSIETWRDKQLVGGLYGVNLGGVFFGESMFSKQTDASKVALVNPYTPVSIKTDKIKLTKFFIFSKFLKFYYYY